MYKIALVNMPFANLSLPSIALTQIKSMVERECDDAGAEVLYLNHDFADLIGVEAYHEIAYVIYLGDWIFRQAAFPDLPDNSAAYFQRYMPRRTEETVRLKQLISTFRPKLDDFLEGLIDRYGLDQFAIVGFTSMFTQTAACFAMARHIKRRNPEAIVVMGGANCEAPMGQELVRNFQYVDYVFSGPSLKSFPRFVRYCRNGQREKIGEIAGVFDQGSAEKARGQAIIGEELDLNEEIELDYDDFVESVRQKQPNRSLRLTIPFETSRGCWWGERAHCTFCGLNGLTMEYRAMEPDRALKSISSLFRYSSVATRLESVDNILPKSYLESVFPKLDTPASMYLFYEVKADLSEEDMRVLSKARVKVLQPGIESLATSTLKLMKKGVSSFNNITFLMNCLVYELHPVWNLLIGFPRESAEIYRKYLSDLPKLVHLPPPTGVYPVRFDRYSPYFKQAQEYGLDLKPLPFYSLTYPFDEESLRHMAYYFGDQNYRAGYMQATAEYIARLQQLIEAWKQKWQSGPTPALYMLNQGAKVIINDSRSGDETTYELSDLSARILTYLARRKSVTELHDALRDVAETELTDALTWLMDRNLLFDEEDRYMSVVLRQKTERSWDKALIEESGVTSGPPVLGL
jgi:ribosomal peptide maturation radical SAM protein 1